MAGCGAHGSQRSRQRNSRCLFLTVTQRTQEALQGGENAACKVAHVFDCWPLCRSGLLPFQLLWLQVRKHYEQKLRRKIRAWGEFLSEKQLPGGWFWREPTHLFPREILRKINVGWGCTWGLDDIPQLLSSLCNGTYFIFHFWFFFWGR